MTESPLTTRHAPFRRIRTSERAAFTLFELVLAVALSVVLVGLIATAINLYLSRVDAGRTEVEEAQLARSILAMIADDIRAATIYQPQDTSAIQQLLESSTPFDVDSIDDPRSGGTGSPGTAGSAFGAGTAGTSNSLGSSSSSGPSAGGVSSEAETMPLGVNGTLSEMYVDSTRLPRREELFATMTGYTNAPTGVQAGSGMAATATSMSGLARPSDLKTVRYFIRPGEIVPEGSAAVTSLDPTAQLLGGGLVRQEIPRSTRLWAEQSGNTALLESGQSLIAPEVVHIEFRYFDGTQVVEYWDMLERNCLPMAIEVSLWITPLNAEEMQSASQFSRMSIPANANEYRQTVYLPMAQVGSGAAGSTGSSGSSQSGSGSGNGMSSGSSTSGGSTFGGSQSGL